MKRICFAGYLCMLLLVAGRSAAGESMSSVSVRPIRVGNKPFTEGIILSDLAAQLISSTGSSVQQSELTGSGIWQALLNGQIDVYPEYTGTLTQYVFKDQHLRNDQELSAALAAHGIGMTSSLGFNNTYALGMTETRASSLGIIKISDLRQHAQLIFGFSNEFSVRAGDGWPDLRRAYQLPQIDVRGLQHDLAYRALASGSIDLTDLYSTDAEIPLYHLRVLADDEKFFPEYKAIFLYGLDLQHRAPAAIAAMQRLEGKIDEPAMRKMNVQAKVDKVPEPVVAAQFLQQSLSIKSNVQTRSMLWQLPVLTEQHLRLVFTSLLAAIIVAVPLGVAAAEFPRFGRIVLIVVAAIYTIPSLALLVFMIPLMGIGPWPAIAALFLYSLLPIVRNTQTGLRNLPASIRESAEVLGLSPWARLLRVEIPLASPSILAGIKTSAVLNVGTATLGALIAAGGYGQPIFAGITLLDTPMILLGAIPAAIMALAFQAGFDLLEPLVIPRGLRLKRQEQPTSG